MFGIGSTELIIIAVIVLVLFGSRLPKVMRSLGSSITEFKKGVNEGSESEEEGHLESDSKGAGSETQVESKQ